MKKRKVREVAAREVEQEHGAHVRMSQFSRSAKPALAKRIVENLARCPLCEIALVVAAAEDDEPPLDLLRRIVAAAGTEAPLRHVRASEWRAVASGHIAIRRAVPLVAHVLACTEHCPKLFSRRVAEGERRIAREADGAMAAALRKFETLSLRGPRARTSAAAALSFVRRAPQR